jgi:hypothetical protein
MDLYNLSNQVLTPVSKQSFDLEKDIQNLVEENLDSLFGLELVASEFALGGFRLDTLAFDREQDSFVIIEYKKGTNYSVIDQGFSYLSLMLNNKADFTLEFNERMNETLKKGQVDWASSRVIFVSPSFNTYQKNSVNFRDVPFELWEIKRFEGDLIALEQHQSSSNESINSFTTVESDSVISKVSQEVLVVSEEQLVSKLTPEVQHVWSSLRELLLAFPDTSFYTTRNYVGWRKGSKAIAFIGFQKNRIRPEILRGQKSIDGEESKGFFYLDDPKKVAHERVWTWKSGKTGHSYRIELNERIEMEYVLFLLKQKYDSI